jgi:hypothetical protein
VDRSSNVDFGYVHIFIEKAREEHILKAINAIKNLDIIQERIKFFRILEDIK